MRRDEPDGGVFVAPLEGSRVLARVVYLQRVQRRVDVQSLSSGDGLSSSKSVRKAIAAAHGARFNLQCSMLDVRCFLAERSHSGFTLIELLVVIALFGILSAMIIPEMRGSYEEALLRSTSRQLVNVCNLAYSRAVSM